MAVTITEYLRPRSVREAGRLLKRYGRGAQVVGGGVSLVLSGSPRPIRAVDLATLGLTGIERRSSVLRLGAMTSLEAILGSEDAAAVWSGVLPEACRTAATRPVRDLITVGGNIVQCYYWSTLPPLLLALEARIAVAGPEKNRTVPAAEFFALHPRKALVAGEIVTRVDIPSPGTGKTGGGKAKTIQWGAAFLKFAKTYNDYAMVNACVVVGVEGGIIRAARLVVGALDTLPFRLGEAVEASLIGNPYEEKRCRDICRAAAAEVPVREDLRASADYRREVAGVMLHRTLALAWRRATDDSEHRPKR